MSQFRLPDLGEGLEEAQLVQWLVREGETVALNQPLCQVETAKALVDIPSPYAGTVERLHAAPGDTVAVGAPLITIAEASLPNPSPTGRRASDSPSPAHGGGSWGVGAAPKDEPGDERISTVGLRKAIAARMVRAATTIPHFTEYGLFDAAALVALRTRLKDDPRFASQHLTYLPFFVRALVLAVGEHRIMNSRWDDEGNAIVVRRAVHVGIATDTERGLLVPVIRDAAARDLAGIAAEAERLVTMARGGKAEPGSMMGGTITITNVGAAGPVDTGAPLINPPEACVVGFGAIKPRPLAVGDEVQVRPRCWISISCDHRIVDGATAAAFLGALVRHLEAPDALLG